VSGRYPLWEQPELAREVEEGIHLLPETAVRRGEQLISSALRAQPQYALVLPGHSRLAAAAGITSAMAAYLVALKLHVLATGVVSIALVAILAWLWRCDPRSDANGGSSSAGSALPAYPIAVRSHSWFGVAGLLAADAAVFLSIGLTYLYLWAGGQAPWPPLEQPLPILTAGVGAVVLWVTSSALFAYAGPALHAPARALPVLAAGLLVHVSALAVTAYGFLAAGLVPKSHAYAALAATVLVYQTLHAVAILATTAFVAARVCAGLLDAAHRVTYDNARLIFHYTVAQGVVAAGLLYVFPRVAS
jgi:cytochrome c oxidase subunit I+III